MPYSQRVAEVIGEPDGVLAGVSGSKAMIRVHAAGLELSDTTILEAKQGRFGRNGRGLQTLARAYAPEFRQKFGDEIQAVRGGVSDEDVEAWLLGLAFPERNPGAVSAPVDASAFARRVVEDLMRNRKLPDETVAQFIVRRIAELNAQYGRAVRLQFHGGVDELTQEQAEAIMADAEATIRREASL